MAVAMRRRLNKMSFQLTDEQVAWLQERKGRLGLTSDTESLRAALNKLMAIEAREAAASAEQIAADERERLLREGPTAGDGGK